MIILQTSRTVLREFAHSDSAELGRILSDHRAMKYAPMPATNEVAEADRLIQWHRQSYTTLGFGAWAVLSNQANKFLGQAGLLPHASNDVELFFSFLPEHWGKGLATEVAGACIHYAFEELNLNRLISIIHPENEAAIRVVLKVGMSRVGPLRLWGRDNVVYEISAKTQ